MGLITDFNKKKLIKKKKPSVWRKEAVWGIQPEFTTDSKKQNYYIAKKDQVQKLIDEQESRGNQEENES